MLIEPLSLEHQSLLVPLLKKLALPFCDYSFADLYLFRKKYHYEIISNGSIYIKGKTLDGKTFIMPTVKFTTIPKNELHELLHTVDFLFPIPEEWLSEIDPAEFETSYKDSDSDYIFNLEKIQQYPGRHLSKKRNLVAQFHELYQYEAYPLTPERHPDALKVIETWHKEKEGIRKEDDYESAKEGIHLQTQFGLKGRIYYVNQVPVGYLLGESITFDIYDLHFAKGDRNIKGIFQFMYQEYAQHLNGSIRFLNFEQDLGIPQLRQSKHSYQPDKILKKYRVFLKKA